MKKKNLPYLDCTSYTHQGDKARLLESLLTIRDSRCGYTRAPCDCKFGIHPESRGEQTGCPELAAMASLLVRLSEDEYKAIMKRPITIIPVED